MSNALVARNRIAGVENQITFSAIGILVTGAATGTNNIVNNSVSGITAPNGGLDLTAGIFVGTRAGGTQNVYYNSVSLTGTRTEGDGSTLTGSFGIAINGGYNPVNVRNNIFSNTQTQISTSPATAKNYAVGIGYAAFTNLGFNNNVLYSAGAQARFGLTGSLRNTVTAAVEYTDFAAFHTATNTNANSFALDPRFVSGSDLHIQTGVPTPVENNGVPIAGITTDFDGDTRNAATPDIGADEFRTRTTNGDFDGDNRTDLTVFRPTDGTWYVLQSGNGVSNARRFGLDGDIPTPGDYDGDGQMDLAVFRPSANSWYIQQSSNSAFVAHYFGAATDKPVQGDYDGDGKSDIAVWRPTDGIWYIVKSSDGSFSATPWGQNGDIPIPSAYQTR